MAFSWKEQRKKNLAKCKKVLRILKDNGDTVSAQDLARKIERMEKQDAST